MVMVPTEDGKPLRSRPARQLYWVAPNDSGPLLVYLFIPGTILYHLHDAVCCYDGYFDIVLFDSRAISNQGDTDGATHSRGSLLNQLRCLAMFRAFLSLFGKQ